jgi:hypothetical protein
VEVGDGEEGKETNDLQRRIKNRYHEKETRRSRR